MLLVTLIVVIVLGYTAFFTWSVRRVRWRLKPLLISVLVILPVSDSLVGRVLVMPLRCQGAGLSIEVPVAPNSGLLIADYYPYQSDIFNNYAVGFVETLSGGGNGLNRTYKGLPSEKLVLPSQVHPHFGRALPTQSESLKSRYEIKKISVDATSYYQSSRIVLIDRRSGEVVASVEGHAFLGGSLEQALRNPYGYASSCFINEDAEKLLFTAVFPADVTSSVNSALR